MTVARGVIMLISGAAMVAGLPRSFTAFSQTEYLRIPSMILVWAAIAVIAFLITRWTVFGRNVYTIGSNPEAARLCGINVARTTVGVYVLCPVFAGVAGILFASRIANGVPTAGQGYELEAIAAAVIGGASFTGGTGSVLGATLGVILIALINNGFVLLHGSPNWQQAVSGFILLVAVGVDAVRTRRERRE
jgi:ribose transport system permease protein